MEKGNDNQAMKGARMQQHAIDLEFHLQEEFNCERFGLGGFVNSDHIRSAGFISSLVLILSKYYSKPNRQKIDDFINDVLFYSDLRMDDIDEDVIEDILSSFDTLYNSVKE